MQGSLHTSFSHINWYKKRRAFHKQYIAEHYRLRDYEDDSIQIPANYNITPASFQPVVRFSSETGAREFAIMKWGLVPYWSKTPKATFSSIAS
jgi:putative SOS response-associated peptidase YedK